MCFPAALATLLLAVAALALAALWPLDLAAVDDLWPNLVNMGMAVRTGRTAGTAGGRRL